MTTVNPNKNTRTGNTRRQKKRQDMSNKDLTKNDCKHKGRYIGENVMSTRCGWPVSAMSCPETLTANRARDKHKKHAKNEHTET